MSLETEIPEVLFTEMKDFIESSSYMILLTSFQSIGY